MDCQRHRARRSARRPLCAVRRRSFAHLRGHAAGQYRPRRSDRRRRRISRISSWRRSASVLSPRCWSSFRRSRRRLHPAARAFELDARRRFATVAGDVRPVGDHPECAADVLHRRQPEARRRVARGRELEADRGLAVGVLPGRSVRQRDRGDRRPADPVLSDRDRALFPRDFRRSRGRPADGDRDAPRLRDGDGASLAVVAIAGVFIAVVKSFNPFLGPSLLIYGFEAIIIGGLGSLWGTLAGGIVLGLAQSIGGHINLGLPIIAGHGACSRCSSSAAGPVPQGDGDERRERRALGGAVAHWDRSSRIGMAFWALARRRSSLCPTGPTADAALADRILFVHRSGESVESARRLCRAGVDRPASLRRARRLHPFSLRALARAQSAHRRADRRR